jgi:hypothetical protein
MLYTIENNEVSDLKFMKERIAEAQKHLDNARGSLEACGDYDRYCNFLQDVSELLDSEDSLCDYFIIQKSRNSNSEPKGSTHNGNLIQ